MGDRNNPALELSFSLAVDLVKYCYKLQQEKKEYVMSRQLLRSSTSIGANLEEAIGGQSNKDFLSKISISYKESRETIYWLRLLREVDFLNNEEFNKYNDKATQLSMILSKSISTLKKRLGK